ncbi:MAG TPA: TIGR03943 family protein [Pseudolysinimonas sp.]|nr:TIGR03943 family protein [Pseudolysinimonas sp.]
MSSHNRFWRELRHWRGVLLLAAIAVGSIWWAITGQLVLFIHPRYLVFTVIMAVVALAFGVARVLVSTGRVADADHSHSDHSDRSGDEDDAVDTRLQRALSMAALTLATLLATGALLLPPSTLSVATASQRDVTASSTSSITGSSTAGVTTSAGADAQTFRHYTVLEWSSLLSQTSDPAFYANKPADVTGFVTPDPAASDVFYVTRFVITCCAVDAQPVGVPVYLPDWTHKFSPDDWVTVTGEFGLNGSAASSAVLALHPAGVTHVAEPRDPYLF